MHKPLIVFGTAGNPECWRSVGDPVMGGVSSSHMEAMDATTSVFSGQVSLANGGGFASVTYDLPTPWTLSGAHGLMVQAEGDGKQYKMGLRTQTERSAPVYQHPLHLDTGGWHSVDLLFADFTPSRRGQIVHEAPPLDPSHIVALSFYISGQQAGPFALRLAGLAAY